MSSSCDNVGVTSYFGDSVCVPGRLSFLCVVVCPLQHPLNHRCPEFWNCGKIMRSLARRALTEFRGKKGVRSSTDDATEADDKIDEAFVDIISTKGGKPWAESDGSFF